MRRRASLEEGIVENRLRHRLQAASTDALQSAKEQQYGQAWRESAKQGTLRNSRCPRRLSHTSDKIGCDKPITPEAQKGNNCTMVLAIPW